MYVNSDCFSNEIWFQNNYYPRSVWCARVSSWYFLWNSNKWRTFSASESNEWVYNNSTSSKYLVIKFKYVVFYRNKKTQRLLFEFLKVTSIVRISDLVSTNFSCKKFHQPLYSFRLPYDAITQTFTNVSVILNKNRSYRM